MSSFFFHFPAWNKPDIFCHSFPNQNDSSTEGVWSTRRWCRDWHTNSHKQTKKKKKEEGGEQQSGSISWNEELFFKLSKYFKKRSDLAHSCSGELTDFQESQRVDSAANTDHGASHSLNSWGPRTREICFGIPVFIHHIKGSYIIYFFHLPSAFFSLVHQVICQTDIILSPVNHCEIKCTGWIWDTIQIGYVFHHIMLKKFTTALACPSKNKRDLGITFCRCFSITSYPGWGCLFRRNI